MAGKRKRNPLHGWLALDKPLGMTSNEALTCIKRVIHPEKIGHAGTLDPLASGLLPVAFGEATKTVAYMMETSKTYEFSVSWGAATSSDDLEGNIIKSSQDRPNRSDIERALTDFVGEIEQRPPAFSAIKVNGRRAYDLSRAGQAPHIESRRVKVHHLELIDCPTRDCSNFKLQCGKGTYVRSIARDLGEKLGCFGHVSALRRIAVGRFSPRDMITLAKLEELSHKSDGLEAIKRLLSPVGTVLDDIPALAIERREAQRLRQGQPVLLRGRNAPIQMDTVFVTSHGSPVAIGTIERGQLKSKRVFNFSAGA